MGPGTCGRRRARNQRPEHQLRHVLRKRSNRRQDERRRAAEEHRCRQREAAPLSDLIVEATALPDLPVHARRPRVVHVQAVHRQVRALAVRMGGIDEGQGDEGPAVFRPAREDGQGVDPEVARDDLGHRAAALALDADLQDLRREPARPPQLAGSRRQDRLGQVHQVLDQPQRPLSERQLRAARRAEQVGDQRKGLAPDVREEQRRAAGGDDPPMDLGSLEIGLHRCGDLHQIAIAPQLVDEASKVREHRGRCGLR